MGIILTDGERCDLLLRHKATRDRREADRIKAVLLRDDDWTYSAIAEALFLTEEGVRKQLKAYEASGKLAPENGGSTSLLNDQQTAELIVHLEEHLYANACEVCAYVHKTYAVRYSVSGMTDWLARHGFTYHQPAPVPAKADAAAQEAFVQTYDKLKRTLPDEDHLVFMDAVHPTHAVRFTKGWIKRGVRKEIPTNGSQKRLNIIGALDLEKMQLHTKESLTINAQNIAYFFESLLVKYPSGVINVILDQARYHTCKEVTEWVEKHPRIVLHYLPPYSPNLNAIEPLWKIMHEHTSNNQYHATFKQFSEKITEFLTQTFPRNANKWVDRLSDNFRIIGAHNTTLHA